VRGVCYQAFALAYNRNTVSPSVKTVSCTELRARLGKYLRAIRRGHSFLITHRGIVIARMAPVDNRGQS